jgi:four helix bundle protein
MDHRDLLAYKKAFTLAIHIFHVTKSFPKAERYLLTDQIRRSSQAVCLALGDCYRKRQYLAHFVLKISDADAENTETQGWLDFSLACSYITESQHTIFSDGSKEVGRILAYMLQNPDKFR